MDKVKTCAACGAPYVGTRCPVCGSDRIEEEDDE